MIYVDAQFVCESFKNVSKAFENIGDASIVRFLYFWRKGNQFFKKIGRMLNSIQSKMTGISFIR